MKDRDACHCQGELTEKGLGKPLLWFLQEGMNEAGRTGEAGLGLASLNNFIELWSVGNGPGHLAPGPGVIRAGVTWEGSRKEVPGGVVRALGWLVCMKGALGEG